MIPITKEELIELFDTFLNEMGMWNSFVDFINKKGYSVKELGWDDD